MAFINPYKSLRTLAHEALPYLQGKQKVFKQYAKDLNYMKIGSRVGLGVATFGFGASIHGFATGNVGEALGGLSTLVGGEAAALTISGLSPAYRRASKLSLEAMKKGTTVPLAAEKVAGQLKDTEGRVLNLTDAVLTKEGLPPIAGSSKSLRAQKINLLK